MTKIDNIIEISCSNIVINNISKANPDMVRRFKNRLTVWEKNKSGGTYPSWQAYLEDPEGDLLYIHKGIPISTLKYYFDDYEIEYSNTPTPYKRIDLTLMIKPRNELQKNTIKFLVDNQDDNQLFVCLKPGEGKTYCAINYITKMRLIPIVIVDNNKIISQWKESFLKFTDVKEEEIFIISGSPSINKLMKQKDVKPKIFIASHRTLQSYCEDNWTLINDLFCKLGIGIKIFDEAHVEWKNIFYIDLYTDVKNTIYLTATPNRSNPSEALVYVLMFSNIKMFGYDESRNKKYLRYIEYKWNSKPSIAMQTTMTNSGYGFDNNAYNEYLLNYKFDEFTDLILDVYEIFKNKLNGKKIAFVFNCNNMIQSVAPLFTIKYEPAGIFCGLVANKQEREKELNRKIILTTLKSFNKAVDVKDLAVVVNTINCSSDVIMEQLSGRLRYNKNYKTYFMQLTDMGFSGFRANSKKRNALMEQIALKQYYLSRDT